MNLWVKRVGQTVFLGLASALFFLACEEDTSFLGYKADQRFNVFYAEISLETQVYQFDSLNTTNYAGEAQRMLVGRYTDPAFGTVMASGITQFFRAQAMPDSLKMAIFDSVSLQLSFDFYNYGSPGETSQQIAVHTIEDALGNVTDTIADVYFSNTNVTLGQQIGSATYSVNPTRFKEFLDEGDTTITIRFPLDKNFGESIFDVARRIDGATSKDDSVFVQYPAFKEMFKGIAITPTQGDKVVGFNPGSASKMVLHFHISNSTKKDSIVLGFSGLVSFSRIQVDRGSSELSALPPVYQTYKPESNRRYIQNGAGVTTKIDFGKFLSFVDTIPNMIINSAELVMDGVQTNDLEPPSSLILRILTEENRFKRADTTKVIREADIQVVSLYNNLITYPTNSNYLSFTIVDDTGPFSNTREPLVLQYSSTASAYNGFMTLFLQELYQKEENKPVYSQMALYPISPPAGKSVNRVTFSDNVKLRISYTRPINQ